MAKNPLIRSYPKRLNIPQPNKSAGILDDFAVRKNIATNEGTIEKTPVDDSDIANKKYVDDQAGGGVTWTDASTNTGTNKTFDDFSNQIDADVIHFEVRNESGSTITKGKCIKITGFNVGQNLALVSLADASDSSTMPTAALMEGDLSNNANGDAVSIGLISGIDTSAFSAGDCAYTSETAGGISAAPTGTALIQRVGVILRSHASLGIIKVNIQPRQRSLPNIADAKFWLGNGSALPIEIAMSGDVAMTNLGVTTVTSSAITANTTHSSSDGSDHSIVVSNQTHAADNTQAHSDYLLNNAVDVGVQMTLTGDEGDADTQYTAQVLHGTDATPPTASNFPIGTIYIQYTA